MWPASPVDSGLLVSRLLLDDGIRLSLRWVVRGRSRPSICRPRQESVSQQPDGSLDVKHTGTSLLSAESTATSENYGTLVGENDLAGDLVDRLDYARHVCSFALSKPASSVSGRRPRQTSSFYAYLVEDLEQLGSVYERTRSRNRSVNLQVLFSVQQLGLIGDIGSREHKP